jgi:hypothetical protein
MSVTKHINQLQFMIYFLEFSLIFIDFRKKERKKKLMECPVPLQPVRSTTSASVIDTD